MKPHADAITVLMMMGGSANEAKLQEAFKEAGIDRGALQYLIMMGYVKRTGAEQCRRVFPHSGNVMTWKADIWALTPKGLELLE